MSVVLPAVPAALPAVRPRRGRRVAARRRRRRRTMPPAAAIGAGQAGRHVAAAITVAVEAAPVFARSDAGRRGGGRAGGAVVRALPDAGPELPLAVGPHTR